MHYDVLKCTIPNGCAKHFPNHSSDFVWCLMKLPLKMSPPLKIIAVETISTGQALRSHGHTSLRLYDSSFHYSSAVFCGKCLYPAFISNTTYLMLSSH